MTMVFQIEGQKFIALNGGPQFTFSPAISFVVNCETQAEIDYLWENLSEGEKKSNAAGSVISTGYRGKSSRLSLAGCCRIFVDYNPLTLQCGLGHGISQRKYEENRIALRYQSQWGRNPPGFGPEV